MISETKLIALSSSSVYRRGLAYASGNHVSIVDYRDHTLYAKVSGNGRSRHPYRVTIALDSVTGDYLNGYCSCPAFEEYPGICKHMVAAILVFQRNLGRIQPQNPLFKNQKTDHRAMQLLNQYMVALTNEQVQKVEGDVILDPVLDCSEEETPSLYFRVGKTRLYIVPDLQNFQQLFQHRKISDYGKNFSLQHSPQSFEASSRPLIHFFLKWTQNHRIPPTHSVRYHATAAKRNLRLSAAMMDDLFPLLETTVFHIRSEDGNIRLGQFSTEPFPLHLSLKTANSHARRGMILTLLDKPTLWFGHQHLYMLTDDHVYRANTACTEACGPLFSLLLDNQGSLFFDEGDAPMFYSVVLPKIHPFVHLETQEALERYHPKPLEIRIYLDAPAPGCATARMEFHYGLTKIQAFQSKEHTESRDIAKELIAESTLLNYFDHQGEGEGVLRIQENTDAVYRLVSQGLENLSEFAQIFVTDAFRGIRVRPPAEIKMGVRMDAGLLELAFSLTDIDLSELPAILASYRRAQKYHRLRDGSFLMLEEGALSGFSELAEGLDLSEKELSAGTVALPSNRALYLDDVTKKHEELYLERDQRFKSILRDMGEIANADFVIPAGFHGHLRKYQKLGFRWLKTLTACGFGGILADDMGLGKTIQLLALIQSAVEESAESMPSIVVCPASLSLNWESEAEKFTPGLRTAVIIGSAEERNALIGRANQYDLLITSYGLLRRDIKLYQSCKFRFVCLDEAQNIKNQSTQNAKAVKALPGQTRFALTGTPVENNLAELWSIFDFLMPGYLFHYGRFRKKYENPIVKSGSTHRTQQLRQLVSPFMLRRLKQNVLKELPPKIETVRRISMEESQKKLYLANLAQAKKQFRESLGLPPGQEHLAILAALTRLRQICCDPGLLYENYTDGSGKLEACMELIEGCIQAKRRILLFSQFTSMLDILGERLTAADISYFRIDGSTKAEARLELVNQFNAGDCPIFLISLKAGGTGLNLTGADVVIHYDPWWNLSAQNQATDRAHRMGQKKRVQVYKLIMKDTVEERILHMQEQKSDLANMIVAENQNPMAKLNREELLSLFASSAESP